MNAILVALVRALTVLVASVQATAPAVRSAETVALAPASTQEPTGRCGEWEQTALAVGWPQPEWPTVDRVMWCESRCSPTARNRSGASGLMQVMPMWWRGRDPLDPATNLTMALEVHGAQGWHAWSCY